MYLLTVQPSPQKPKAPAPGGEGLVIDPLSKRVMAEYLAGFATRAQGLQSESVRAYYHDSFEYACDF